MPVVQRIAKFKSEQAHRVVRDYFQETELAGAIDALGVARLWDMRDQVTKFEDAPLRPLREAARDYRRAWRKANDRAGAT